MAFHQINIGSKSFELAPTYIQSPDTAKTNDDYGFLLFKYDINDSSISKLYSPGSWDLPSIKYSSGHISAGCNILPNGDNNYSVGSSSQKFNTMYAITFHGNLNGNASSANKVLITTQTASDDFPIIFGQSDSVTSTGVKSVHVDAHLNYNPSTNTLTTTNFNGTAKNATYIHVSSATNTADASYYIQFVNERTGNRKSYTDANLYYNSKTNILTTTQVNAKLNGPVQTTSTSTNASYYISFVNASATGMRWSYVDSGLYYNPSTNELSAGKLCGYFVSDKGGSWAQAAHNGQAAVVNDATGSGGSLVCLASMTAKNGRITIGTIPETNSNFYFSYHKTGNNSTPDKTMIWDYGTNNLTATTFTGNLNGGVTVTAATASATYYISFVNGTSGARIPYVDAGLYYNPSTNELSAGGGFFERSDERLKDFQEDIEVNFSYLHNIPKKYYSWKDDTTYTRHIGTSAQEVKKYYPELVNTDDDGYLTMNYDKLSVVALKAIDILHEEVTGLKKENAELKERLARLEELILNNR